MRHAIITALALCLASGGCRDKKPPEPIPEKKVEAPTPTPQKEMVDPAPPGKKAEPAVATSEMKTIKRSEPVLAARLAWTGTHFAIVWPEASFEDGEETVSVTDSLSSEPRAIYLDQIETFAVHLVMVDGQTAEAGTPVALEGAGSGPKALTGPALSVPAWHDGALALAWSLWNIEASTGTPVRYVLGRWKPDGTPVGDPVILSKDHIHHADFEGPAVTLVEAGGALAAFWAVETTPQDAGCENEHGISDGIAEARVKPDGSVEISHACGDVLTGHDAFRLGDETCVVTHNEHIGYHTWMPCVGAEYYSAVNPYERHLAVSGGLAVWYDELDEEFELRGHCLDIFRPDDKAVVCARFKSMRLAWNDAGLAVEILTKDGETHALPLAPGDHVPAKLLRRALEKKVPFEDAVWSGHSIGLVWSKGKQVRYKVLGPDALRSDEEPPSAEADPSP